jgi:K+-sensing histidine kinase KdpD
MHPELTHNVGRNNNLAVFATNLFIASTALVGLGLGLAAVMAEYYAGVEEQCFIFAMLIGYNAIKYNKPGGSVQVLVTPLASKKLRLSVRDNGFGIPADRHDDVFVSSNSLGRESGEQEGAGIGLVISKDLLCAMGGIIGFESQEGLGSTFWIELDTTFFTEQDIGRA